MSKKEVKENKATEKKTIDMKKVLPIVICAVVVLVLVLVCVLIAVNSKKSTPEEISTELPLDENGNIDFSNIRVTTIKFRIKNSLGKDIERIYIRDNTNENFSRELSGEIKDGEEVDVEYGNYAAQFIWDFKVVFKDGTDKTLNSMLAANVLYDGASIELVQLGDNIDVVNHDMITFDDLITEDGSEAEETPVEETVAEEVEEVVENTAVENTLVEEAE